jgi:hypothetical protein
MNLLSSTAREHETRAPHPPLHPRLQSSRFKVQKKSPQSGKVPVVLDDFVNLIMESGSVGLDECINRAIEAITQELHLKQLLPPLGSQMTGIQPSSPHATKLINDNQACASSPRISPLRQALINSAAVDTNDSSLPSAVALVQCLFCAASQEPKEHRDRTISSTMGPTMGDISSPRGTLPMRTPVATCDSCNGGICEFHIMLHSVKMPSHWDSLNFHDDVVDSAYRSLPPQAQLLSRVMLR